MSEETKSLSIAPARLPYPKDAAQFGYDADTWRVLVEAIFPNAKSPHSVILALCYCKARGLDPLKRPIHIVPIWDSKRQEEVETIWPGIGELRTTAARTKEYAGKGKTVFGPNITETFRDDKGEQTVIYPEWAQLTVYRMVQGERCAFDGPKVFWKEIYATRHKSSLVPNGMWTDRPSGQLEKCSEAAALRAAFPEEIGNDYSAEEMEGRQFRTFNVTPEGHELQRKITMPSRTDEHREEVKSQMPAEIQPSQPNPSTETVNQNICRGIIARISAREVMKRDKTGKFNRYTIIMEDGTQFATIREAHIKRIGEIGKGALVDVTFSENEYGKNLESVEAVKITETSDSEKSQ